MIATPAAPVRSRSCRQGTPAVALLSGLLALAAMLVPGVAHAEGDAPPAIPLLPEVDGSGAWVRDDGPAVVTEAADHVTHAETAAETADPVHDGVPGTLGHGEDAHGEAAHEEGLPQLNPRWFSSQIFWTLVFFGTLYFMLSRKALPQVTEVLRLRRERIAQDLDQAEAHHRRREEVDAFGGSELERARTRARAIMGAAEADVARVVERRQGELQARLEARTAEADRRLAEIAQNADATIRQVATEIAQAMVASAAGLVADEGRTRAAVDAAIAEPEPGTP